MNTVFTICSMNFFRRALVLLDSFTNTNPGTKTVVFIVDRVGTETMDKIKTLQKRHCVVFADALNIEKYNEMCFKYNLVELNTAIKPDAFNYVFANGAQKAIYLDPDILVLNSLNDTFILLDKHSAIVTPHLISDGFSRSKMEKYFDLHLCGIMNLGFIAVANDDYGKRLISWWKNKLLDNAFVDKYLFTAYDQKWADSFTSLFGERIFIQRNPGYNVASWNINERELLFDKNCFSIEYENKNYPLYFFHYSGYKIGSGILNWRFPEFKILQGTPLQMIVSKYNSLIDAIQYPDLDATPYAFSSYTNGSPVLPIHRRLFRQLIDKINSDPFDAHGPLYKSFLSSGVRGNENYGEDIRIYTKTKSKKNSESIFKYMLLFLFHLLGLKRYLMLLEAFYKYSRLENNTFLVEGRLDRYLKK